YLTEVGRFSMIDYVDTIEIRTRLRCERSYLLFFTDDRDLGDTVASADLCSLQCARVVAFRKDDVLKVGRCSRSDLFEDHCDFGLWFLVFGLGFRSSRKPKAKSRRP